MYVSVESNHTLENSLEVGEDDQTDDQGDNRQAVTHHSQVVQTDGKLQGQKNGVFMININKIK